MTVIEACPLCGNKQLNSFLTCTDYTVSHENFHLARCAQCSFVITTPRPIDERIGNYYQSDNYISHANKATTLIDRIYLIARSFTLKRKLNIIKRFTSERGNKILDYGCGTGEFIKTCMDAHWQIRAVEPSDNAREKAKALTGSNLIVSSINQVSEKDFDAITLWHVLEHVPDLDNIIQALGSRLKDNGAIFIAVPNHKSWDARHYQQYWAGYDVPRHLWHFNQGNIEALLKKNSLKLSAVLPMKLDSFYISMLSEKYKRNGKSSFVGLISALFNGVTSNLSASGTGEYSSLIYIIKK